MSIAESIVNELLENEVVRVCTVCEKEFGVPTPPNASHGYCKRHTLEMYKPVLDMARQKGDVNRYTQLIKSINEVKDRPDSAFPPDMSQQRQAQPAGVAQ